MENIGRESKTESPAVTAADSKTRAFKTESTSAARYGSAEHHEKFAESLMSSGASGTQIRGRLAAARGEATHPSAAVTTGKGAAKAKKARTGITAGAERGKSGSSR